MQISLNEIKKELHKHKSSEQAQVLQRFFKTGKGEYGENDKFLGVKVPFQRKVANKYTQVDLKDVEKLLQSEWHEERLTAIHILNNKYNNAELHEMKNIYDLYIKNIKYINNWDLVDSSAPYFVGHFLFNRDKDVLYRLAKSKNLWERRISIMATYYFIRQRQFDDTLKLAKILLGDDHDIIQKAVGWMLREVGNRHLPTEERFLKKYYKEMPRTMLRYAIEKFPEKKRKEYLYGTK
ncbi:DNA alkylation repair protein [Patescibacteria group bacterium]|nr:DNA alkylation repair protein [Patescibacteria group bacterium]MBU1952211.1 DNA alkylation repair protein [Patescibacteria group bacterium]